MKDGKGFEQSGQNVQGPQTNIGGNAGTVLSGKFEGPVYVDSSRASVSIPIPRQIPLPPLDFTGRDEELQELFGFFERGDAIVGLRGMGGVGKSALAFALAEGLRYHFPDGQLFISMLGTSPKPLTPAEAMAQVIRSYAPALRLPESEEEMANLYRTVLDGKCALLLLDNALDDHQVRPLLPPAKCCLVVTSRRKFSLPGMRVKDLDVLKLNNAVDLLHMIAGEGPASNPSQKNTEWKKLAGLCGCLPVALKAAGSFLANTPGSSPERYIKELQDERKRLGVIGKEGVEEDALTKFSLSYSRLAPETAQVFRLLSIFPADFYAQAEEAICQDEGHLHLIELVRWSLVEYQRPSQEEEGRYHLHDLVRLFAAGRLEEEGSESDSNDAGQRHAEYFRDVLSFATKLYENGNALAGLKIFDMERTNIESAWAWARGNLANNNAAASICNAFLNWPYLLELRLHPQELIAWLETALAVARQLKDRSMEGVHLGNLGLAYDALGDAQKAIEYYEQALTIARDIGERRNEGAWLGNLGLAYADLGDAQKPIEYYEQALTIARDIGERRNEGAWLGNLGSAYYRLGETSKALQYYNQQMEIAHEIGERYGEGNSLWGQAICSEKMNNLDQAIDKAEKALNIFEQIESPSASNMRELISKWRNK